MQGNCDFVMYCRLEESVQFSKNIVEDGISYPSCGMSDLLVFFTSFFIHFGMGDWEKLRRRGAQPQSISQTVKPLKGSGGLR